MDTVIPYHPGMLLGRSANMKAVKPGYMLIGEDVNPTKQKVNETSFQFSFVTSEKDVCNIFGYSQEYALKVRTGIIDNEMFRECLKNLGKENSITILFRATFLEQNQYLHSDTIPVGSDHSEEQTCSEGKHHTTESLLAEAAADSELGIRNQSKPLTRSSFGDKHSHCWTHWVKAVEIGNELITKMTISCKDIEKLDQLNSRLGKCLKDYCGQLDTTIMQELKEVAMGLDKKFSKKHYEDVGLGIWYGSFTELDSYPASLAGMVKTIDTFMDQCVGWAERSKKGSECKVEACTMRCVLGTGKNRASFKDSQKKTLPSGKVANSPSSKETQKEAVKRTDDGDKDSTVVLDMPSESWFCYKLRVTLQSFKKGNIPMAGSYSSGHLSRLQETTNAVFDNLFKLLTGCDEAELLMQDFLSNKRYILEAHRQGGEHVLSAVQNVKTTVEKTVADLDFVCLPQECMITTDPLSTVETYIETVTSKLPPGRDIDLLLLGKTGNGKSATGNSILGRYEYVTSAEEESETTSNTVGWTEIDGRIIKVVDTPGVYDTKLNTDKDSLDLAFKSISEAIASCPEGFHALLLILRYGVRYTNKEKKAIYLLKHVLGEDIIKSYCICVITHGDILENKLEEDKITFEEWCKTKTGFLKELFTECKYRCVLFNNDNSDPMKQKTQLIKLVSQVDILDGCGVHFTNDLFQFAQGERSRIELEENVPLVSKQIMKDLQLIMEHLNNIENNSTGEKLCQLTRLQDKIDMLNNKVSETDKEQFGIVAKVLAHLTVTLHSKIDEISQHLKPKDQNASVDTLGEIIRHKEKKEVYNQDFVTHKKEIEKLKNEFEQKNNLITRKVADQLEAQATRTCFPGSSMVTLSNGKSVPLGDLQVGDKVLVRDSTGHLSFDTVYMFGHKEYEAFNEFITMQAGSYTVCVTGEHYVFCVKHEKEVCVAAKDVQVGDCLLVVTSKGCLTPQSVVAVTFEKKQGLFAPFTNSGTIIVDGVLMSCYIDVLTHSVCHTLLWPVRQLYRISPRMLSYINGSSLKYPVPRLAKAAMKLI